MNIKREDYQNDDEFHEAYVLELDSISGDFLRTADFTYSDRQIIVDLISNNELSGQLFLRMIEAHKQWGQIIQGVFDEVRNSR